MRISKAFLAVVFGGLLIVLPVAANAVTPAAAVPREDPEPSPRALELARRYIVAMQMERTLRSTMSAMTPVMVEQMKKAATPGSEDEMAEIMTIVSETSQELMSKMAARMLERAPRIYAQIFSEAELQGLAEFYEGPTGQAVLIKMPIVSAKLAPIMGELVPEYQAAVMTRAMAMMCKRHPDLCAKTEPAGQKAPPSAKPS